MEEDVKTLGDFVAIVKRRKVSLILPFLLVAAAAVVVVMVLPRIYRSTATILIEEQEIPKDFVVGTVTGYAEQRLQMITQRTMSSSKLLQIINKFNLYADLRSKETTEEIVSQMQKDIKFATISADVIDQKSGRPTSATIAFTLSYKGKNPETVQQVANTLTSLYLEENLKSREQQAEGATKFLEGEANDVKGQLAKVEAQISSFKEKHTNELPELLQLNLQEIDRVDREVDQLKDQFRTLKEKEGYLQVQLASIPTETANEDKTLLKELKARLVQLQSKFSDKYPDVIKAKAEIAQLEHRLGEAGRGGLNTAGTATQSDNPAYVTLASQLASTRSDIESVQRQIKDMSLKRDNYTRRTAAMPRVEETYKGLMVGRNNLQAKYDDLTRKLMEARVAHGLEKEQMGERFTLIDPAKLPEKPVSPNIPAILLIGVVLGLGAGVGTASLKEYTDDSLRSAADLEKMTSLPVLGVIPVIVSAAERATASRRRKALVAAAVAALIAVVLLFHFFVMDLTVAATIIMRRAGM
jgi:polysaccharide biosynthesis transport protein